MATKTKKSHGGAGRGQGRHRRPGRRKKSKIENQVSQQQRKIRQLEGALTAKLESKSTVVTKTVSKDRWIKEWFAKCRKNLTIHKFINALKLNGTLQEMAQAEVDFEDFTAFQEEFMDDFVNPKIKTEFAICTRGGSKTALSAIGAAFFLIKYGKLKVATLSGSWAQTEQLTKYLDIIFDPWPWMFVKNINSYKKLKNKSEYFRLPTSKKGVKSKRLDVLILDEAVEIPERVLSAAHGMLSTSKFALERILTTPNLAAENDKIKEWFDEAETNPTPEVVIYKWTWLMCPWINQEKVRADRKKMSIGMFNAEYNSIWGGKTGSIYILEELQKCRIQYAELPLDPNEIKRHATAVHVGIDWGSVHLTVAIAGYIHVGILYVFDAIQFDIDENRDKDQVILDILDFCKKYDAEVFSEEAPISASDNFRLEKKLLGYGLRLHRVGFGKKAHHEESEEASRVDKETYLQDLIARVNHGTIKITERVNRLYIQMKNAVRDKNGDLKKQHGLDDYHDAGLHLNESYEGEADYEEVCA